MDIVKIPTKFVAELLLNLGRFLRSIVTVGRTNKCEPH